MNKTIEMIQQRQVMSGEVIINRILKPMSINEIVADLNKQGYQLTFRREATCLYCIELNRWVTPDSFMVDKCYYFNDNLSPDGDRMIYAISTLDERKGFFISACLVYEDNISPEMKQRLTVENVNSLELEIN